MPRKKAPPRSGGRNSSARRSEGGRPDRGYRTREDRAPGGHTAITPDTETAGDRVFGPARVEEALRTIPSRIRRVILRTGRLERRHQVVLQLARIRGIPVQRVPNQYLERLAVGARHQGAAAEISAVRWRSLAEVIGVDPKPRLLLLADRVEDPRNFGALVRAADGAGADAVLVPRRGAAPPSPAAISASAGALVRATLVRVPGAAAALRALREAGYWTVGLTPRAETPWYAFDWTQPSVLVVGSEGRGLRAGVAKECEATLSLPQLGAVRSLNVAVAAGIVLYEAVRQRELASSWRREEVAATPDLPTELPVDSTA